MVDRAAGCVRCAGGGAIVHQSEADGEFDEVRLKLGAPLLSLAATLGKAGADLGSGGRLACQTGGKPARLAFTTMPWDPAPAAEPAEGGDGPLRVCRPAAYIERLAAHADRLQIPLPPDFTAQLLAAMQAAPSPATPRQVIA